MSVTAASAGEKERWKGRERERERKSLSCRMIKLWQHHKGFDTVHKLYLSWAHGTDHRWRSSARSLLSFELESDILDPIHFIFLPKSYRFSARNRLNHLFALHDQTLPQERRVLPRLRINEAAHVDFHPTYHPAVSFTNWVWLSRSGSRPWLPHLKSEESQDHARW